MIAAGPFHHIFLSICAVIVTGLSGVSLQAATTTTDVVTIVATVPTANEANTQPGLFTISRTGATGNLTVLLDSSTGTAKPGLAASPAGTLSPNNYLTLPNSVIIPDGSFSTTVVVQPFQNDQAQGGLTVVLVILPNNATYITGSQFAAQVEIADDDLTASVLVPKLIASEPFSGAGTGTSNVNGDACIFRLELKDPTGSPHSLPLTAQGNLTVDIGGTAPNGTAYSMAWVLGKDIITSTGQLKDSGRRSFDSRVVGGSAPVLDGLGNVVSFNGNSFTVTAGTSRSGSGVFKAGDVIAFTSVPGTFVILSATPAGNVFNIVLTTAIPNSSTVANNSAVITAIPIISGATRFQLINFYGYSHIEFECIPLADNVVTGSRTITLSLEGSNDYAIVSPTAGTAYIADTTAVVSIGLVSNTVEGGAPGVARITTSRVFPFDIRVPFSISGTAAPSRFNIDNSSAGNGFVMLPALASSVDVKVTAKVDSILQGPETVVLTLISSLDYQLAGTSGSSLNPSSTVNIDDPNSAIVIIPNTPPSTTPNSTTTNTSPTVNQVRPLPTSSAANKSRCGLGNGIGFLVLAFAGWMRSRHQARV